MVLPPTSVSPAANPYWLKIQQYLQSQGINPDSPQGQAAAQQMAQQAPQQTPGGGLGTQILMAKMLGTSGGGSAGAGGASTVGADAAAQATGGADAEMAAAEAGSQAAGGGGAAASSGIAANAAGMGALPIAGIAAGTYLGGKSLYDMLKGKDDKSAMGYAGRATLGIATGGLSELARPFLMHESTQDYQKKRDAALLNSGQPFVSSFINQRNQGAPQSGNYRGKVDASQSADYVGISPNGWVNNKFATSGDVKDLQGNDVVGSDAMMEKFGNDYFTKMTSTQRSNIAQAAVDTGAVSLHKGETNIDWSNPALQQKVNAYMAAAPKAPARAPIGVPRGRR